MYVCMYVCVGPCAHSALLARGPSRTLGSSYNSRTLVFVVKPAAAGSASAILGGYLKQHIRFGRERQRHREITNSSSARRQAHQDPIAQMRVAAICRIY
jgi:hypothetical protein